jgi:hypothetical protein
MATIMFLVALPSRGASDALAGLVAGAVVGVIFYWGLHQQLFRSISAAPPDPAPGPEVRTRIVLLGWTGLAVTGFVFEVWDWPPNVLLLASFFLIGAELMGLIWLTQGWFPHRNPIHLALNIIIPAGVIGVTLGAIALAF